MLPVTLRGLAGTRLLQEYFAFPAALPLHRRRPASARPSRRPPATRSRSRSSSTATSRSLEGAVEADNFQLHCVPAINLFERRADRLHLDDGATAYHVVPGANRHARLRGVRHPQRARLSRRQRGAGLPAAVRRAAGRAEGRTCGYYSAAREPRLPSDRGKREGPRSGYVGDRGLPVAGRLARAPVPQRDAPARRDRSAARTATCRCSCRPGQAQGELSAQHHARRSSRSTSPRARHGRRARCARAPSPGACSACSRSTTCRSSTATRRTARQRCARSCRCSRSAPTSA